MDNTFLLPLFTLLSLYNKTCYIWHTSALRAICILMLSAPLYAQPGNLDSSFVPSPGANDLVIDIKIQPDGKILLGGLFTSYNNISRNLVARLNVDGSLDTDFQTGIGGNIGIIALAIQPDGKILIGGYFTKFNGKNRARIARLNVDGSIDEDFDPGTGADSEVHVIVLQPDGKILIGGNFKTYDGTVCNGIARLNTDGSFDQGFKVGTGTNGGVYALSVKPNGKILVGGGYTIYNGAAHNCIVQLNADGSLDTGFNTGMGANDSVLDFELQPDGKIIIGGYFTKYNNTNRPRVSRLNADGSLDMSFDPGAGASNLVNSVVRLPDGKILIGGHFTNYNGTLRNRVARLNTNGSLDTDFNPGTGPNSNVEALALQPDGKILIGGGFRTYNNMTRYHIARLNGNTNVSTKAGPIPLSISCSPNPTTGQVFITLDKAYPNVQVIIHNTMGQQVLTRQFVSTSTIDLNLEDQAGLYFIEVRTDSGQADVLRVIKM